MLICAESGLIVFKLVEGDFTHTGCYVDILMDDMAFPAYTSSKIKSKQMTFNEGELLVLCWGRFMLIALSR